MASDTTKTCLFDLISRSNKPVIFIYLGLDYVSEFEYLYIIVILTYHLHWSQSVLFGPIFYTITLGQRTCDIGRLSRVRRLRVCCFSVFYAVLDKLSHRGFLKQFG